MFRYRNRFRDVTGFGGDGNSEVKLARSGLIPWWVTFGEASRQAAPESKLLGVIPETDNVVTSRGRSVTVSICNVYIGESVFLRFWFSCIFFTILGSDRRQLEQLSSRLYRGMTWSHEECSDHIGQTRFADWPYTSTIIPRSLRGRLWPNTHFGGRPYKQMSSAGCYRALSQEGLLLHGDNVPPVLFDSF